MTNLPMANKNKILNLKRFNQIIFVLIIVLGVYYVAGMNDLTVKGFKLQELKIGAGEATTEGAGLEQKIMSLKSNGDLNKRVGELNMVAVGNVEYISAISSVVAKK
jgi:lipoate-protein ligase A